MILENVTVCDLDRLYSADVEIVEGWVVRIGEDLLGDDREDAKGKILLPALFDTNVRLKDAQLTGKNMIRVAKDARKGGVGTIVLSPDTVPAIDNAISLEFVHNQHDCENGAAIETTIAATIDDERFSDIAILLKRGAVAPYMTTSISNHLAVRIAEYVKMFGGTLFCKAHDRNLSANGMMVEGPVATRLGLVGIPPLGETVHVARMIEIAREFDIAIVFKSIASSRSIEMITAAKREGVKVACEVSIHHLLHCDRACDGFNTVAKLDPPLQRKHEMMKLFAALQAGEIDMLTMLHQPNSPVNKEVAFADAAYGCESIADALPLLYTRLVHTNTISWQKLIELCVQVPARTIGKEAGRIAEGVSDLVLFDPTVEYKVTNTQSLYCGDRLRGEVTAFYRAECQ